jgi:integrase
VAGVERQAPLRVCGPRHTAKPACHDLIERFLHQYPNPHTAACYRSTLIQLFAHARCTHPSELTRQDLIAFCTWQSPSNNTVYTRRTRLRTFLRWCASEAIIASNPADALASSSLRTYRRTYGKVQAKNPGRWLTRTQAFDDLVAACQNGTILGLRDELIIRLGLNGLRLSEIRNLRVGNLRQLPTLTWTGKGRKPRTATLGPALLDVITRYLDAYPNFSNDDPLICPASMGRRATDRPLTWHTFATTQTIYNAITGRARKAGLGHVAPHDLRRTAAGLLHNATNDDGTHHFDLLDIQRVLGHADPATTMRSYLEPLNTDVFNRAACTLE